MEDSEAEESGSEESDRFEDRNKMLQITPSSTTNSL